MSAPRTDDHRWPCRTHPMRTLLEGGHEALFSRCSRMAAAPLAPPPPGEGEGGEEEGAGLVTVLGQPGQLGQQNE